MTEQHKKHEIKTVEVLQIAAGLTAALRWAIALMPLDGMRFALNEREWFEPVSFGLSLAFAAVEIGATAYIMRAWRKETDKQTQAALMLLWMVALALMVVAQVPPLIANIDGVSVATFPTLLKVVWVTCGVSVTFVVIGGVGYAEKSLEAQPTASTAQGVAQGQQEAKTDGIGPLGDDAGRDEPLESTQQAKTWGTQVFNAEPVQSTITPNEAAQTAVLEHAPVTTADIILEYVKCNPSASKVEIAQHVARAIGGTYTRQAVAAQLQRLEVAGRIARNGHVEVLQ
jgi:hypothetical protein